VLISKDHFASLNMRLSFTGVVYPNNRVAVIVDVVVDDDDDDDEEDSDSGLCQPLFSVCYPCLQLKEAKHCDNGRIDILIRIRYSGADFETALPVESVGDGKARTAFCIPIC
jgi:hypothetical protein